jgi:hypothetical protein
VNRKRVLNQKTSAQAVIFVGFIVAMFIYPSPVLFFSMIAILLVFDWTRIFLRARSIRRFALEHRCTYMGDTLPRSLGLGDTSLSTSSYGIGNTLSFIRDGIEIVIFDLTRRRGKSSVTQSVAAFRRAGVLQGPTLPVDRIGSYEFEEAGNWLIGYSNGHLAAVADLEDWGRETYDLAVGLIAEANGTGTPFPRLFSDI